MPSATRSGPISLAQATDSTTDPEINATETDGYNTRGKSNKFSNTKAPFIPPPVQPTKRRAPPVSVARKRQRGNIDSTAKEGNANLNPGADTNNELETPAINNSFESTTENPVSKTLGGSDLHSNVEASVNRLSALHQTFTSSDLHDTVPSNTPNSSIRVSESNLCETSPPGRISVTQSTETGPQQQPTRLQQTSTNDGYTGSYTSNKQGTTAPKTQPIHKPTPDLPQAFTTPCRPAQPLQFTPSAVVIIQTPPAWNCFTAREEHDFSVFRPGSSALFAQPSARIENVDLDNLDDGHANSTSHQNQPANVIASASCTENVNVSSETRPNYPDRNSRSNTSNSIPTGVYTNSAPHTQPAALVLRTPTSEFSQMYNAIRQSLPSTRRSSNSSLAMIPVAHMGTSHAAGSTGRSNVVSRSHSVSTTHSHSGSGIRSSSLAFDDRSSHGGSMSRDSPGPVTITCPPHVQSATSNGNISQETQRSLRQRNFTYDQVLFMNAMKRRWHWSLIAEDLFPINANMALQLCMQYAEEDLEVSRNDYNIGQSALEFVRRKDSSIRCELQTGVLSIIEESYNVNNTTIEKLNELISQSNYVYTEYNIETKKVSGRYRHPCLIRVLAAVLFTKRKRGRPIGVRFMPLIMQAHHSINEVGQAEGAGITTSMIALACTLVLYGLQSIKAGDSSQRLGTRKEKPVPFTERRYSGHYRNFANKIKQYDRIEEVRGAYLEEIMRVYLQIRLDQTEDSDVNIEADDEMHSDGD